MPLPVREGSIHQRHMNRYQNSNHSQQATPLPHREEQGGGSESLPHTEGGGRVRYSARAILLWFLQIFRSVKLQSTINALSGVIRVGLDFAFIWATKQVIDVATGVAHASPSYLSFHLSTFSLQIPLRPATLMQAGILLVSIMALQLALGYAGRWIAALLGVDAQNRMQRRIFAHLLRSEWHGHEERHSGDVLNRLVADCTTVVNVATDTLPQAFAVVLRLACAFIFLYNMDSVLALSITFILPVFILLSRLYVQRMRAITREVRQTDSRVQATLQESLQHRVVLKTLERVYTMIDVLRGHHDTLRRQVRHRTLFSSTSNLVLNMGFGGAYLFAFLWSANRLAEGSITFGMMTAFIQLCGQIQGPFRELTRFIPAIIGSFTAAERLMELEETALEDDGEPLRFEGSTGIRVADVSFAYDAQSRHVLQHFSADFPPGTSTAILGETGAGKTTLIRLMLALLKPTEGQIEMYQDERHRTAVSPRTRCNIVYVPQGNTLFSGTLRWNLLLGRPDATDEEMHEALRLACATFVHTLPDGLDTHIGEGGAGLSEGQAQRIAIARALLRRGSIMLLDEATSALDQQTEQMLLSNLIEHNRRAAQPPTLIFITHRTAVIEHCQQVITLQRNERQ